MPLAWIATALLSASWLWGLGYYYSPNFYVWASLVALAAGLLSAADFRLPARPAVAVALALVVPAVVVAFWPHGYAWHNFSYTGQWRWLFGTGLGIPQRAGLLLLAAGLLVRLAPDGWRFRDRVAGGVALAGLMLLAQAIAIEAYEAVTARNHDLPAPLGHVVAGVARLLGLEVGLCGSTLAVFSMRETHQFGVTWELLFDPVTACFLVGGIALLAGRAATRQPLGQAWPRLLAAIGLLLGIVALWLPLRAGLMLALFMHEVLRAEYDAPLTAMRVCFSPAVHLLLLLPAALLAWRFLPRFAAVAPAAPAAVDKDASRRLFRPVAAAVLAAAGIAALTFAVLAEPVGRRADGRVLIEETHVVPGQVHEPDKWPPVWEPTDRPMDTQWYGNESGYNYYCLYDYSKRFYDVARQTKPLDDAALAHCDVLVLKTPRRPYSDNEIESIVKFVDNGGGLLLVGEHTDVYATGRNLNAVARCFGFQFRYDCLFGMDSVFDQRYELPLVPHPILQGMPGLDFATSCSIAPRDWSGRAAIRSTGLKNLVADYHVNNFYPQPFDRADMRYGAFVQLWTASYGAGRVAAFADSTIFSNFSACEPGKAELWLGMLEWLNHRDEGARGKRWWAGGLGLALLIAAAALGFGWPGAWLVLLTAGLAGWAVGVAGVRFAHAQGMPLPEQQRPLVQVVMDRTVSSGKLPKGGFIAGKPYEFGIFERWILRLGYFYARRGGHQVFENSDLAIFLRPNKSPSARFVEQLEAYVAAGGKVLVIEAPPRKDAPVEDAPVEDDPNAEKDPTAAAPSTANELLAPFGLKVGEEPLGKGKLRVPGGWPAVDVPEAVAVEGGTPLAVLNGRTVAASVRHGEGLVTAIGFGDRFSDAHMGVTGDVVPDETLRQVYELQFSLLRAMIEAGQLPRAE